MKLKKLEIFGFKSFADKEDFVFEPGITVIVGPNGCGKSNVMDAIKWILGEQSAKSLRGREMSDIIFGGSKSRPAVGFAEASLTMSNEEQLLPVEYKEVSIARRLYTSGESEYLINKNRCRLKDIRDLFLGTGVGVNSYSIIEQGKVEALLQANAQERRLVFEEAAGISKFKLKKRETLLKLEKTQQNLLRVNDIIREVERQLRSLKIQATKARKYKEYCKRLQELRIKLSLKNFRELHNNKEKIAKEINSLFENCKNVLSVIDKKEVEVLDFENQLSDINQKASESNTEIVSIDAQVTNNKNKKEFCKEKLNDLDHQELNYNEDIANLKKKIEENKINEINLKNDLDKVEQSFGINSEVLASKKTELDQISFETDIIAEKVEEKKSNIMDIFHDQSKIQNEIGNQTTINETLKNRKNKVETTQQDINNQISLTEKNIKELQSENLELTNETTKLTDERSDLKTRVEKLNDKIQLNDNAISEHEKIRSSKQSRLEVLEDYELRSEGVDDGAKAILEEIVNERESFSDITIYGLVADIIKVDLKYARAVETALGDLAQSVITKSYEDSKNAIKFLKERDAGHATFLLLDKVNEQVNPGYEIGNVSNGVNDQNFELTMGIVGKASDLVKYDNEFKSIIDYLLDKTLVVEDFDKASSLLDTIDKSYGSENLLKQKYGTINRIVTLDGSLIENSCIIKGGVIRENSGLILRKSEIDNIHNEILDIESKIAELQSEKSIKVTKFKETNESLDITIQKIEKINIQLLNNQNDLKQEQLKLAKFNEEKDINISELKEIDENIDNIDKRNAELRNKLRFINDQHSVLEEEVNNLSQEISNKSEIKVSIQEEITELKVTIAQEKEKKETYTQTLEQTENNVKELNVQIESKLTGIENCKVKRDSIANELDELEKNIDQFLAEKRIKQDLLNTLVGDRNNVLSQLTEIKTDLEIYKTRHKELEDELNKLRLKENEFQVRSTDMEERIYEDYNIKLSEIAEPQRLAEEYNGYSENKNFTNSADGQFDKTTVGPTNTQTQTISVRNSDNSDEELVIEINDTDTDWKAVNLEIEELKSKVEKTGGVNLDSIAEQEEFEERYQFLTNQRNDLEKSEKSLKDIIEKLNQTSRELFEKTFTDIKENFHVYFRKLFGGGKSNIVLEEGIDILDAGIEIVIQPPNKEFKSIALFSGGEKVLITVALLFAILKSKPTPFCLMDEVDAALDENNIGRFTSVLREFAQESQFIIISHNKKTMSVADVIYGVTMEEPGVSKKVSVKFDRFNESASS